MPAYSLRIMALVFVALGSARADTVVVVCPDALRPALADWAEFREGEGHTVQTVVWDGHARDALARVAKTLSQHDAERRCVWLLGDGSHAGPPSGAYPARVIARYGSEPSIASDLVWACGVREVSVARLPLNDPDSIRRYLARVIRRERRRPGWSDTRLQIVAGAGGFSPLVESAVEAAATGVVKRLAPETADLRVACVEDVQARSDSASSGSEGRGGVWVWLGHGLRDRLPGLTHETTIRSMGGADTAVLLACYTGDFAAPGACVAERLLTDPDGPVGVVASTRISMPYGNTRLGAELLRGLRTAGPHSRVGELVSSALDRSVENAVDPLLGGLDSMARLLGCEPNELAIERDEHRQMYHLLGDPLLAAAKTEPLAMEIAPVAGRPGEFAVSGSPRESGRLVVEWRKAGAPRSVEGPRSLLGQQALEVTAGEPVDLRVVFDKRPTPRRLAVRVGLESPAGLAVAAASVDWGRDASQLAITKRDASFSAAARASTKKPVRSASSSPSVGAGR